MPAVLLWPNKAHMSGYIFAFALGATLSLVVGASIMLDRGPYCPLTGDSENDMLYLPPGTQPVGDGWWITARTIDGKNHECVAWTTRHPSEQ